MKLYDIFLYVLTVLKVGASFAAFSLMGCVILKFGKQVQHLCFPLFHPPFLLVRSIFKTLGPPLFIPELDLVPPSCIIGLLLTGAPNICAGT